MIKTFLDAHTEALFNTGKSRRLPIEIQKSGLRRLRQLDAATTLNDLRGVGAALESRGGDRYTVRINDRYRLFFDWRDGNAHRVEIADDHRSNKAG